MGSSTATLQPVRKPGSMARTTCLGIGGWSRRLRRFRAKTSTACRSAMSVRSRRTSRSMLGSSRRSSASSAALRKNSAWGWPSSGSWCERRRFQVGPRDVELDLERPFLVAPVDRQHAVRRDVRDRLGVVEVVAVFQPLPFGDLGLAGDDLAGLPDDAADRVADRGHLADRLGEDVADAFEHLLDGLDPLLGVEELRRRGVQVGQGLVAVPDPQRQRLQPLVARLRRLGLLLGLERQVEVFEPLGVVGCADRRGQLVGELALRLDRLEDRLLALGQLAEPADPELDLADRHLVQVAGPLFAVTGDERHRVALVEQLDDALHLNAPDLQILRDPAQVDLNRGVHRAYAPDEKGRRRGGWHGPPPRPMPRNERTESLNRELDRSI